MTRWLLILGPGRSGTSLLAEVLNRSPQAFIAPETKFFHHIWSQRLLLRLIPRRIRTDRIVNTLIRSEYPRESPIFPAHREEIARAVERAPHLAAAFPAVLNVLSDQPVLGEKSPWHTFFVDPIQSVLPDVRFLAITRDAPATVASTLNRTGFRRVGGLRQVVARWRLMNRELLRLKDRLDPEVYRLISFEDLVSEPERTVREVAEFARVPFESAMLEPQGQDSSLRDDGVDGAFDVEALERWRRVLDADQTRYVRGLTWRIARRLGYDVEATASRLPDRLAVAAEEALLHGAVAAMRAGLYPFGAATGTLRRDD